MKMVELARLADVAGLQGVAEVWQDQPTSLSASLGASRMVHGVTAASNKPVATVTKAMATAALVTLTVNGLGSTFLPETMSVDEVTTARGMGHASALIQSDGTTSTGTFSVGENMESALRAMWGLDAITLEEFAERFSDLRSRLVFRELEGEITAEESIRLRLLNSTIKRLLPQPEPLPRKAEDAIDRLNLLIGE